MIDPGFANRARKLNGGFIVGGQNYGQGSSREHAALAPMYLGVKAVITQSFARIHLANLVNFGIMPLVFQVPEDYRRIEQGDTLEIDISDLKRPLTLINKTKNITIPVAHSLSARDQEMIKAGGALAYAKEKIHEQS